MCEKCFKYNYDKMTSEEQQRYFDKVYADMTKAQILEVPGVYEALWEDVTNDVLERWEDDHPEHRIESEEDES